MNKADFFKQGVCETKAYEMPDGAEITIVGLTVAQRGKMRDAVAKDSVKGQALVVCMACTDLDEGDIASVMEMDGGLIQSISDAVLEMSGLISKAKN